MAQAEKKLVNSELFDRVERMLEAAQALHGKLVSSPLWEMIKTEPVIVQWMNSLGELEKEVNLAKQAPQK